MRLAATFLLGAVVALGGLAGVQAMKGGTDLSTLQDRVLRVAAQQDDQAIVAAAHIADSALAADNPQMLGLVAVLGKGYTDGVGETQSALGLGSGGPEPDWFFTCFDSTAAVMRGSASIFESASSVPSWSDSQATVVRQTVADLDKASQLVDMVATGGQLTTPKSAALPGPNGNFDSQTACTEITHLGDALSQRIWPG